MGLDFLTEGIPYEEDLSFDDRAHWSYSGFHQFRNRLMQQLFGVSLDEMEGFRGNRNWSTYALHELYPFLRHSDCDEILTSFQCRIIGPALTLAVWDWEPKDDYDRINAIKLAAHMHYCACSGKNLKFC